uniref:DUF1254 domain-containing protein n=1 Tax=Chromera velia CCMP2878 TaxID=1169474 RepID=A0A0G4HW96_9ALVE|mmetsp:Transcript_129/g.320  ORF Transcript_129/g.320 Transcript_129/m.320 type:complete len:494 (+) Transcript_129:2849-4330(+)|eukprot:Cvel_1440.t1-p1 / transcript=Cvel_1440.t1 / gene=Cvel_1440 / organism=Chromera_velia_CCMP2878 / gene_product=hypothetical protein / transcript_product=hypothetical protein / location=Cvel_scaffold50:94928-97216(+) / protein_length=493 / sequence_SO=supercontig / SO=protein_coding / is_pseudo=false
MPSPMHSPPPPPPGVGTPDEVETRLGTLKLRDGVPDASTAEKVYENLDFQRGVQAFLSTIQVASMFALRRGITSFGPPNKSVLLFEDLMDTNSLWLTANTDSVYCAMWLDLSEGPMMIRTPPSVLGFINTFWFKYVTDFGNCGPDQGKGGCYLVLPPDYKGNVEDVLGPDHSCWVVQSPTYSNWCLFRGFLVKGSTETAVENAKKNFRCYPFRNASTPSSWPEMQFVNASGTVHNTIHSMDFEFFEEVNTVVQEEPPEGCDPEILGLLRSIGIEKGKPFAPDARMKKILIEAAAVGSVTARAVLTHPRGDKFLVYPDTKSSWTRPFVGGSHEFLDGATGARLLDARTMFHFYATGITPAMVRPPTGTGSAYACAFLDSEKNPFRGDKHYRLHLPPNIPAKNFWSVCVYDNQTRSMLPTPSKKPAVGSQKPDLKVNADGSVDVFFGPSVKEGMEASNWVQTLADRGWNSIFRLYGPLEPWYEQTWRPSEIVPLP